jgi:hypothetical protein
VTKARTTTARRPSVIHLISLRTGTITILNIKINFNQLYY